jgi:hypothetical protein
MARYMKRSGKYLALSLKVLSLWIRSTTPTWQKEQQDLEISNEEIIEIQLYLCSMNSGTPALGDHLQTWCLRTLIRRVLVSAREAKK